MHKRPTSCRLTIVALLSYFSNKKYLRGCKSQTMLIANRRHQSAKNSDQRKCQKIRNDRDPFPREQSRPDSTHNIFHSKIAQLTQIQNYHFIFAPRKRQKLFQKILSLYSKSYIFRIQAVTLHFIIIYATIGYIS
jgi:hypothetical protein